MLHKLTVKQFRQLKSNDLLELLIQPLLITKDGAPYFAVLPVDSKGNIVYHEVQQAKVYRPGMVFKPGDKLIVPQGKQVQEIIVPELDADGSPMPEY